ncbi:hypothetical protein [Halalkalicoccus ordinarius]
MATNSAAVGIDHPTIVPTNLEKGAENGQEGGSQDGDDPHAER